MAKSIDEAKAKHEARKELYRKIAHDLAIFFGGREWGRQHPKLRSRHIDLHHSLISGCKYVISFDGLVCLSKDLAVRVLRPDEYAATIEAIDFVCANPVQPIEDLLMFICNELRKLP